MNKSEMCDHHMVETVVPAYRTTEIGVPVVVIDAVKRSTCNHCGEITHLIPFPERLIAAAVVLRAKMPEKLVGREIVFFRKSLEMSAKKLADFLGVVPETVSRWENNHAPMSPHLEKLLRVYAGAHLAKCALAVDFNPKDILELEIKAVRGQDSEIELAFELVSVRERASEPVVPSYADKVRQAA